MVPPLKKRDIVKKIIVWLFYCTRSRTNDITNKQIQNQTNVLGGCKHCPGKKVDILCEIHMTTYLFTYRRYSQRIRLLSFFSKMASSLFDVGLVGALSFSPS